MNSKPELTWQMVALFGLCLAAIIVSHAFAPTAAAAVVSLVSTTTGFVFAMLRKGKDKEEKDEAANEGESK